MAEYNERKLVMEAQAGRREAFERILQKHEDRVFNLVARMVGVREAEDVAQEALIEVCRSISSFRGRSSLSTWIYRVAVNVCLEHRRKRRPDVIPFDDDFIEHEPATSEDMPAVLIKSELKSDVERAVRLLPDLQRDVVVLHELQGLTYRECAEVLDCPVGTVKSRLSNAFSRLRELLKEHESEGGLVR